MQKHVTKQDVVRLGGIAGLKISERESDDTAACLNGQIRRFESIFAVDTDDIILPMLGETEDK